MIKYSSIKISFIRLGTKEWRMNRKMIFLLVAILILINCVVYEKTFHPEDLKGEARVIKKLSDGNYLVTAGYVGLYWDLCMREIKYESACMAKILNLLVAENSDGTWIVKPKMVEKLLVK